MYITIYIFYTKRSKSTSNNLAILQYRGENVLPNPNFGPFSIPHLIFLHVVTCNSSPVIMRLMKYQVTSSRKKEEDFFSNRILKNIVLFIPKSSAKMFYDFSAILQRFQSLLKFLT